MRRRVRALVGIVAALATIAVAVQMLVLEPIDRSARAAARSAAAREAALAAAIVRQGGAAPVGARIVPKGIEPVRAGGVGSAGDGRIVWVPVASTAEFAGDVRRRVALVAGIAVLAVTGWALWAGLVRRREAERDTRRQLEIVAMVAHDLRSPLTGIGLAADRLTRTELPAARAAARAAIDRECARLAGVADDILSISTLAVGSTSTTDALSNVLEDVARRVRAETGRELTVEVDASARVAPADVRVARVVANLAENAARHSPAGRPVRLRATVVDGAAEVVVEDDGSGFAPSFAISAFARGEDGGRAGLGLASSRRIVEVLGGTLRIGRAAAGGAVVSLRVPPPGAAR